MQRTLKRYSSSRLALSARKNFHSGLQLQAAFMGKYPFGERAALDQELPDAIQWVTSRTPEQVVPTWSY